MEPTYHNRISFLFSKLFHNRMFFLFSKLCTYFTARFHEPLMYRFISYWPKGTINFSSLQTQTTMKQTRCQTCITVEYKTYTTLQYKTTVLVFLTLRCNRFIAIIFAINISGFLSYGSFYEACKTFFPNEMIFCESHS